jgi:hypothetical protein
MKWLWHLHKWSPWSEPFEQPMTFMRSGQKVVGCEHMQRRTCTDPTCNEVQERTL